MLKRVSIGVLATAWVLLAYATAQAKPPEMHGRAAVLIDETTGQVLFSQNAREVNFPASTTKLLTALVAVERGSLDQVITVSANAIDQAPDSSSCYLSHGEKQRLEYLLYGLLLASGNDCAIAIAEGITDGRPDLFMKWMNETAKRLGATKSLFTNPHGLHDSNHYSTALDLALIARGALANPVVRQISSTREFNWPGKNNGTYYNHNALLFTYDSTTGGKTGFTEQAKFTLVSAAARNGRAVIGVVMGEESKLVQNRDMRELLDYGLDGFETKAVVSAGSPAGHVAVISGKSKAVPAVIGKDVLLSVPKGTDLRIKTTTRLDTTVAAPVKPGQQVGTLEIREGEFLIAAVPVVAESEVQAVTPLWERLTEWGGTTLKWIGYLLGSLLALRLTVKAVRRMLRKHRKKRTRTRTSKGASAEVAASYRLHDR